MVTSRPAIASGLTDYQNAYGHERRTGVLHGLAMITVVVLMAVSMALRWWAGFDLHAVAVGISTAGLVGAAMGMYLGGHLTFGMGTMINPNAFMSGPTEFVPVGTSADFPEASLRRVDVTGMPVLIVRRGGVLLAIGAVCSHAGGPLEEGEFTGTVVTCPWHGSKFDIRTGAVRRGPATFSQPRLTIQERDGKVEAKLDHPIP